MAEGYGHVRGSQRGLDAELMEGEARIGNVFKPKIKFRNLTKTQLCAVCKLILQVGLHGTSGHFSLGQKPPTRARIMGAVNCLCSLSPHDPCEAGNVALIVQMREVSQLLAPAPSDRHIVGPQEIHVD